MENFRKGISIDYVVNAKQFEEITEAVDEIEGKLVDMLHEKGIEYPESEEKLNTYTFMGQNVSILIKKIDGIRKAVALID